MSGKSRLEPTLCLQWVTERPYKGGKRQSPDFRILQTEWYLEIELTVGHECQICMRRRSCSIPSNYDLTVDCQLIIANGKSFSSCNRLINAADMLLLYACMTVDQTRPSGSMEEWTVVCMLKDSGNPFSLRVENKTINMSVNGNSLTPASVDECVQVSQEVPRDVEALSSDISSLLRDGILPDFELKCGGRIFPVHRSVLAARSEVFRAMMRNKMLESESGSADIKDLEDPVLESLLKFLYSGKFEDLSEDTICKLYGAADKYAVRSLLTACSYWLIRNLTVENCINYLHTADSHSDPDLKSAAVSFILANPGVFNSTAWLTFLKEHVILASEVLQTHATASLH